MHVACKVVAPLARLCMFDGRGVALADVGSVKVVIGRWCQVWGRPGSACSMAEGLLCQTLVLSKWWLTVGVKFGVGPALHVRWQRGCFGKTLVLSKLRLTVGVKFGGGFSAC